ncbi:hypothetical protein T484DRAFT_1834554 [Baffinella frigidus]|nr:hypothetical protein T484DRAFT_1834554 [Cryptophyta sp. CCMP2293]
MGGAEFGPFAHEAVQVLRHVTGQPDARSEEKESATDNAIASLGRIVALHSDSLHPSQVDQGGGGGKDNAIASLGRIVALHSDSLHPSQVDQVWVEWLGYLPLKADEAEAVVVHRELCRHGCLPLKADEAEAVVVHRELCRHVVANQAGVMGADHANLPRIIAIFAQVLDTEVTGMIREIVLETEGVDTEVTGMIREIVNSAHTNVPHLL